MAIKKPFKGFVIVENQGDCIEVSTFTDDRRGNRIPLFLETKEDAWLEIAEHIQLTCEAVKRGDIDKDNLDEFCDWVAQVEIDKKNNVRIFYLADEYNEEIIFEGTMRELILKHN